MHRIALCVIALVLPACGRLAFDDAAGTDAAADTPGAASYARSVLDDAPWAYFRLGETAPVDRGIALDATNNGHDAPFVELAGGSLTSTAGALVGDENGALRVTAQGNQGDGSEAGVRFGETPALFGGEFTIELFVRLHELPTNYDNMLVFCEGYLKNGFRTGLTASRQVHVWNTEANAGATGELRGGTLELERWTHVAVTKQGETFAIYVDGEPVAALPFADYLAPVGQAECGFGALHGLPGHADFDEIAIYPRGLSQARLQAHLAASGR